MTNDQMIEGRFLKLQRGKRMYMSIINHIKTGGHVLICTYHRAWKITAKQESMIKLGKSGSVYMQHGKRWDNIDFCTLRFYE